MPQAIYVILGTLLAICGVSLCVIATRNIINDIQELRRTKNDAKLVWEAYKALDDYSEVLEKLLTMFLDEELEEPPLEELGE